MATRTVQPGSKEAKRIDAIANPKVAMVNAPPPAVAAESKANPVKSETAESPTEEEK